MNQYLFSYSYYLNGQWHFGSMTTTADYFDDKTLGQAQQAAATRHNLMHGLLIIPIAVSKLDRANVTMRIKKN